MTGRRTITQARGDVTGDGIPDRVWLSGYQETEGGMWQGILVSNHEIVAPHNGVFKNISAIPEIREEAQDVRYAVTVVDGDPDLDVFPLKVEKLESGKKTGQRIVGFDRGKWAYQTIGDF